MAARPALALPNWFMERTGLDGPVVFNPRSPAFLAGPRGGDRLPAPLVQRIAYQLEQRCRDVAPRAFREEAS